MEALKKNRKVSRTMFTKNGNELENLMNSADGDINEIKALYELFSTKSDALAVLDEQIYTKFLEDEAVSEEELESELEHREVYRKRYVLLHIKFKEYLEKIENKLDSDNVEDNGDVASLMGRNGKRNFKLPTIQFKTFDGNIKDWLPFWSQFSKVHDDPSIDLNDKVEYLLQATLPNSRARQLVESFPTIGKNYHEIINCLKARFGREDLQIEIYVRELLKLIINNAVSNSKIDLSLLYDGLSTQLRALEILGVASEGCASMLFPLIESCLPEELLRVWQRSSLAVSVITTERGSVMGSSQSLNEALSSSEIRLKNLMQFLKSEVEGEQRITLATEGFGLCSISSRGTGPASGRRKITNTDPVLPTAAGLVNHEVKSDMLKCIFCDNNHHESSRCFKAQNYSLEKRKEILSEKRGCFRCLKIGHQSRRCHARLRCIICGKPHVVLMCPDPGANKSLKEKGPLKASPDVTSSANMLSCTNGTGSHVFLQTLKVKIDGLNGSRLVRVLIDTGSQNTYILKTTAELLGYTSKRQNKIIHCLFGGVTSEMNHECYDVKLSFGRYSCVLEALSQPTICADVSPVFNGPWIEELETLNIKLSDQSDPAPIEILIGSDVAGKLYTGQKRLLSSGLVAVETLLGWTLMGRIPLNKPNNSSLTAISLFLNDASITQLWQLDVLGIKDPSEQKSKEELTLAAQEFFLETVSVDLEKRYKVRLPWIEGHPPIPSNYNIAKKRLQNTLTSLKNTGLHDSYDKVFKEWVEEGIIEQVWPEQLENGVHYLPHRPVVKEASTTKIRPVFDASAKGKDSPSLNQCLEKGPNLIELIPDILVRFRQNRIGVSADIRKAFLQISVHPSDRNFLRFIWTDSEGNEIVYRHKRVVFGVSSSPFLLAATLNYHLSQEMEKSNNNDSFFDRNIISILSKSFYVDNCVASLPNEEILKSFIRESSMLLSRAKFDLRGWEYSYQDQLVDDGSQITTAILGLVWDRQDDTLFLNKDCIKDLDQLLGQRVTKRVMLSLAQRIFDPVGFTCPVTLVPKLLLQKTWESKLAWDTEVDEEIGHLFHTWLKDLHVLIDIRVPRWIFAGPGEAEDMQLHVFCDASKNAYAAVIFLRCICLNQVRVSLVAAKSRVAPIKMVTIPRLELLAAVIGTRLSAAVQKGLGISLKCTYWTDSTTVLSWISRNDDWGTFVHNRVTEIRTATSVNDWRHVPGVLNPADLPSRGCSPKHLYESRWWEGPEWLQQAVETWPKENLEFDEGEVITERKKKIVTSLVNPGINQMTSDDWHLAYFSSFLKTIRMIAWVFRFLENAKHPLEKRRGELTAEEINEAEVYVLKLIQAESFKENENANLKTLDSFTDERGLIRLKSRVSARRDNDLFRYPIVLPSKHPTVAKIIFDAHIKACHVRTQGLLCILREKYWVLGGRRSVRSAIGKCVICKRHNGKPFAASAPPLPLDRVRDAAAFEVTGVDFAGPVFLKDGSKAWICLFTCAVYRAVHLELCTSLSVANFMQALRRFIARRGRPKTIFSDNGTNFVGTDNVFKGLDWDQIAVNSCAERITWRFNPPTASWWGGFWERLVGALKQLLRKTLGHASLGYEGLLTVLCDCESVINSRPLSYLSSDRDELVPLTPMSFLREQQESGVPDCETVDSQSLCKKVLYLQKIRDVLRKRFRVEYLGQLSLLNKGCSERKINLGDVVLIGNDNDKRMDWPLGLVNEVLPARDGKIRLVRLKTARGQLLRPIQRLYPLECAAPDILPAEPVMEPDAPLPCFRDQSTNSSQTRKDNLSAGVEQSRAPEPLVNRVFTRRGRSVNTPKRYL